MKKVLIANRGENACVAGVSANGCACVAGNGDLALLPLLMCAEMNV